jgi:copper transporter 1
MMMSFHLGYSETVLFDWWKVSSVGELLGSMAAIFIIAVLYEALKYYRLNFTFNGYISKQCGEVEIKDAEIKTVTGQKGCCQRSSPKPNTMFSWVHAIQTALQITQVVLGYCLMLIFMTYNVWLCVALVSGTGLGYFLFGWRTNCVVDACECCN